jgi:hypothetical protein
MHLFFVGNSEIALHFAGSSPGAERCVAAGGNWRGPGRAVCGAVGRTFGAKLEPMVEFPTSSSSSKLRSAAGNNGIVSSSTDNSV